MALSRAGALRVPGFGPSTALDIPCQAHPSHRNFSASVLNPLQELLFNSRKCQIRSLKPAG